MEYHFKIIQCLESHISSTLTKMKLEKLGYGVEEVQGISELRNLAKDGYDLILLDASTSENDLVEYGLREVSIPLLYLETDSGIYYELDQKLVLNSSFAEEDFLQKYHLAEDLLKKQKTAGLTIKDQVMSHYSGDESLALKICSTFLDSFSGHLDIIEKSFQSDTDDALAKKVHSFKGSLSALGETQAAKLIRKIEILIRARQRQIAKGLFKDLIHECHSIAVELESLTS